MYVDKRLEFCDAQAFTTDEVSDNVIDLSQDRDIGVGRPMWLVVVVTTALDAGNSDETYLVELQTDDNAAFSSATQIGVITMTRGAPAGTLYFMALPASNERYLRLNINTGGTSPSGAIDAFLTDQEPQVWQAYANAI